MKFIKYYTLEILLVIGLWMALDVDLFHKVYRGPGKVWNIVSGGWTPKKASIDYVTDWDKIGIIIIVIASVFYIKKYLLKDKK